jgi:predicted P-loop ATPase
MIDLPDYDQMQAVAPDDEKNLTKGQRIEKWLIERYDFRYNEVKAKTEWRKKDTKNHFEAIRDYDVNDLARALRDTWYWNIKQEAGEDGETKEKKSKAYLNTSTANLMQILESSFAPKKDPIKEYLNHLPYHHYSGNAIQSLADTIKLASWYSAEERQYWYKYLTAWMVGCVANALNDHNCLNHLCLVLVGDQGLRKGFWIEELLPRHLAGSYIKTDGNFDPRSKDSVISIAQYFILHLDDMLKKVNLRDYNEIKNCITRPDVKVRKSYGRIEETLPHRASFIATVNDKDFLTDTTGARRFMPFEIESIDYDTFKALNKDEVWTNAMHLYHAGHTYWVTREEEDALKPYKENFAVEFTEEGLLLQYFYPWHQGMPEPCQRMTTTMILQKMQEKSFMRNLSDKKLGGIMKKLGFEEVKGRIPGYDTPRKCYLVVERDQLLKVSDREINIED